MAPSSQHVEPPGNPGRFSIEVAEVVRGALTAAGVDPDSLGDEEREGLLDEITDETLERLETLDSRFLDVYEPSMELCRQYARGHGLL